MMGERDKAIEVSIAPTAAIGSGGASASVLDASGYVVARRMATVSSKITGRVKEVLIEEGQRIEEGQVMARLDPVDADAQRRLYTSQLSASRSQVDGVQAQLREAEANATRLGSLVKQQLVAKSQYDQAIAQRDVQFDAEISSYRLQMVSLAESEDPRKRAALEAYANGDRAGALDSRPLCGGPSLGPWRRPC